MANMIIPIFQLSTSQFSKHTIFPIIYRIRVSINTHTCSHFTDFKRRPVPFIYMIMFESYDEEKSNSVLHQLHDQYPDLVKQYNKSVSTYLPPVCPLLDLCLQKCSFNLYLNNSVSFPIKTFWLSVDSRGGQCHHNRIFLPCLAPFEVNAISLFSFLWFVFLIKLRYLHIGKLLLP